MNTNRRQLLLAGAALALTLLAGATAYLTKPFTKDSLLQAVRAHALPSAHA
mgnify:CR=1 FL=1